MATQKEIREILKDLNFTESDMNNFWNDLIETNTLVKSLDNIGKTWKDMNISVIRTLPTQKQRDIESNERKAKEKQKETERILKEQEDRNYYSTHFNEIMLSKIDNNIKLDESELRELAFDFEVEREEGDSGRWSQGIRSYIQIKDRYFVLDWDRGLTENQPNEFYNQPYEVIKEVTEKIIPEHKEIITEWIKIKK